MNIRTDFDDRVLNTIYELQFVGRVRLGWKRDSNGQRQPRPLPDKPPLTFELVPVVLLLAEFYQPNGDNQPLECNLRPTVRRLASRQLIERFHVDGGEALPFPDFPVPLESVVGVPYVRPDGISVQEFRSFIIVSADSPHGWLQASLAHVLNTLRITDGARCMCSGIRVGPEPIYWVLRRFDVVDSRLRFSRHPAVAFTMGFPFEIYAPAENYSITPRGTELVESSREAKIPVASTTAPAEPAQPDADKEAEAKATGSETLESPPGSENRVDKGKSATPLEQWKPAKQATESANRLTKIGRDWTSYWRSFCLKYNVDIRPTLKKDGQPSPNRPEVEMHSLLPAILEHDHEFEKATPESQKRRQALRDRLKQEYDIIPEIKTAIEEGR